MSGPEQVLSKKKIVFLDLDGTVYLGNRLIEGADRFLKFLEQHKIRHFFLSNNSSRSKQDYVKKLRGMGIRTNESQIILSTDGVIAFLSKKRIKEVYVVGTGSMKQMFLDAGIQVESAQPKYVVLGYDTELTYDKLRIAVLHLQNKVPLIATHCDLVCPTPEGPVPDVGSLLALFEKATRQQPVKIFGKPNAEMVGHILKKFAARPQEVIMIGDRIYTDMELAYRISCDFILVLSGETKRSEVKKLSCKPSLIVRNLGEIIPRGIKTQ